jgi:hypothetical protein
MKAKFIYETAFVNIQKEDIINKDTLGIWTQNDFNRQLFMYSYAQENNLNPEEMDEDEWIQTEKAEKWIEYEIESRFYDTLNKFRYEIIDGPKISIWRKMTVPNNWLEHLQKEGNRLGIHWSWDPDEAEEHWGYDESKDLVLIESVVNIDYINWSDTIRLNMDPTSEDEKEIRLFKNTPLQIISLQINEKDINIMSIKNKIFRA